MSAENLIFHFTPITEENFKQLCEIPAAKKWIEGNFVSLPSDFELGYHCAQSEDGKIILYPLLRARDWRETYFVLVYQHYVCVLMFGGRRIRFPYYKIIYWSPEVNNPSIKERLIAITEAIIRQGGEFLDGDLNPNHSIDSIDNLAFVEEIGSR